MPPASPQSCIAERACIDTPVAPIGWPLALSPPDGLTGSLPPFSVQPSVIARWPDDARALSYVGQTLVTRKRRFADGLALLDRATAAGAQDPYILYTAAWCREFVANAIERPKGAHQRVTQTPAALYAQAFPTKPLKLVVSFVPGVPEGTVRCKGRVIRVDHLPDGSIRSLPVPERAPIA